MNGPDGHDIAIPRPGGGPPVIRPPVTVVRQAPMSAPPAGVMPNALDLLKALRYRWPIALMLGLLCAGLAGAVTWFVLPAAEYSAQALLEVRESQPRIIFDVAGDKDQAAFATYQQTQLTLLKSRVVLNAALRDPEIAKLKLDERVPDPIAWLEEKVRATYRGEVLQIAMNGPEPNELATLVNAVTDAYVDEVVNVDANQRRKRYEALQEIYQKYQLRLQEKRKELKALADQVGANNEVTMELTQELAIERRELAKQELLQLEKEISRLQVTLDVRREAVIPTNRMNRGSGAAGPAVEARLNQDPALRGYAEEIAAVEDRIERYRRVVRRGSDPAIRDAQRTLAQLQEEQKAYTEQLRARVARDLQSGGVDGPEDTIALEQEIRVLRELAELARSQVESFSQETRDLNHETWLLQELQDEIAQIDAAAKRVGGEVEALNVELEAPPRVALYERAEAPRLQEDKRPKMAAMAGIGSFGLALLGVSLLEYRTRRVRSIDEVVGGLQLRLVGALPALPGRRARLGKSLAREEARHRSILLESVDAMRTLLLHVAAVDSVRSVMITSAVEAEGKTSLASHLATSLARGGRRTLLVDGDLRKPDVHRLFDLVEGPGLSDLLRGEAKLDDDVIQASQVADLWILPAGRSDDRAIQALAHRHVGELFDRLAERFDFVVVDTAPVLPVADTLLIGQHMDGAICSVLRDVSRVPKVSAANDRLRSVGVRILGAVMTGIAGEVYGSEYYYAGSASR